jgi:hypothetical protein
MWLLPQRAQRNTESLPLGVEAGAFMAPESDVLLLSFCALALVVVDGGPSTSLGISPAGSHARIPAQL